MRVKTGEYSLPDIYKFYTSRTRDPISYTLFKDICQEFNKEIITRIIDHSQVVQLPHRFGNISILKYKMSFKNPVFDYQEYKKTGIKSFLLNDHSDDYQMKFFWEKSKCVVKGKSPYVFKATRTNTRRLAQSIKTHGHSKYLG